MKIGTICKLKVDCLGNKAGTLGVVFYDYGDGVQAIFENGNLDGFSRIKKQHLIEVNHFLEEVGFEESLAGYQFKNVVQVAADYRAGVFNIAWSEGWKKFEEGRASVGKDILRNHKFGTEKLAEHLDQNYPEESEYEKCEVYADGSRPALLRFKRKLHTGEKQTPTIQSRHLSVAMDYADFSHFEYADLGKSLEPRWIQGDRTLYPKYVVFRKKLRQERKCRKCGCTDLHACPGPCYWVEDDLCSECAPPGARGKTAGSTGIKEGSK